MARETQGQDVTPGVGAEGNFFNDFFIDQDELDGKESSNEDEEPEEEPKEGEPVDDGGGEEPTDDEPQDEPEDEPSDEPEDIDEPEDEPTDEPDDSEEPEDQPKANTDWDLQEQMENYVNDGLLVANPDSVYDEGDEGMRQLIDDTVEARIQERLEEEFSNDDEEVAQFREFKNLNPSATFEDYAAYLEQPDYESVDETDPETALYLLEDMYELQGLSEDEIRQNIDEHKASKSVGRHARRAKQVLIKWQEDSNRAKAEADQARVAQAEAERLEERRSFEQRILKSESIGGIEISPKERQELADYIMKPVNKEGMSQMMIDEAQEETSGLLYAYIKKNKIDLSKLQRNAETKSTIKFKKSINKHTDKLAKGNRSAKKITKEAADGDLSGLDSWNPATAAV